MAKWQVGDIVIMTEDNSEGVVTAVGKTKLLVSYGDYTYIQEAVFSVNDTIFIKPKPKQITINKDQFIQAWDGLVTSLHKGEKVNTAKESEFFNILTRRIGL